MITAPVMDADQVIPVAVPVPPGMTVATLTFDAWMDSRGAGATGSGRKKKASEGQLSLFDQSC